MLRLALFLLALGLAGPAAASTDKDCEGQDLLAAMTPEARENLEALVEDIPFARGNFWRATREAGGRQEEIILVGTYHLEDPRHAPTIEKLAPLIASASGVLVEAGPEAQKALKERMARDPYVMLIDSGPSLLEQMPAEDWALLTAALAKRGVPAFFAAKLRPWYVNLMLATPPCAVPAMKELSGLDGLVITQAQEAGVPVASLEPYDTVLTLFNTMPVADQISMIRTTLAIDDRAEDFSTTLANAYFAGQSWLLFELSRQEAYRLPGFTRAQVDAEFARMEAILMSGRNITWIPVLEAAAARGPVVAAFGALHLPGENGVPALLERRGFTLAPLEF